jgi:hypothetical protein
MNIHRYFLLFGIILCFILAYDVYLATKFPVSPGSAETTFGLGFGTLLMAANVVFISLYTFSCHSFRHMVGGVLDVFSRSPLRKKAWDCVTCINKRHGAWAMVSLYTMCSTDLYIRLCRAGWARISQAMRGVLDDRIAALTRTRDLLGACIGCGCLSLKKCALYNPGDRAARHGSGPRFVLEDRATLGD